MRIAIDARYLRAECSGIGVYSEGLLKALGRLDQSNEYFVFVHSSYREDLELPDNFQVIEDYARPVSGRTMVSLHRPIEKLQPDALHSLFPLAPVFWKGKLGLTVHDLQPLVDPDFTGMRSPVRRFGYDMFYRLAYPFNMRRARCWWFMRECRRMWGRRRLPSRSSRSGNAMTSPTASSSFWVPPAPTKTC